MTTTAKPSLEHQTIKNVREVDVIVQCFRCKCATILRVEPEQYAARLRGASVQDAFPQMHAGFRELFVSHTCSECYDEVFSFVDYRWHCYIHFDRDSAVLAPLHFACTSWKSLMERLHRLCGDITQHDLDGHTITIVKEQIESEFDKGVHAAQRMMDICDAHGVEYDQAFQEDARRGLNAG